MLLKKIQECTFGKEYAKFPTRALISNIGNVINSKYPDYAPVITADEKILVFTSKRNTSTGGQTDPDKLAMRSKRENRILYLYSFVE